MVNILVIDVGGSHVKIRATGETEKREFKSNKKLTAAKMVRKVRKLACDWPYDVVSIGYPGPVLDQRVAANPHNLGAGWTGFDFKAALGCPVKLMNDAAMQALGSYCGGRMLFLGFGTGLGTTMIVDGTIEPMELGHLPYKKATYEDYVGARALRKRGKKKWRRHATRIIEELTAAMEPDEVVLGGGNADLLHELPPRCRLGDNENAFVGGFRMWEDAFARQGRIHQRPRGVAQ